jgi:hypothetical protein
MTAAMSGHEGVWHLYRAWGYILKKYKYREHGTGAMVLPRKYWDAEEILKQAIWEIESDYRKLENTGGRCQ